MFHENPSPSSGPVKPSPKVTESAKSGSVMIARVVGILFVAGGFMLGIQGLDQPDSPLLSTALGLIVAGLVAQVYALIRSWYVHAHRNT
jgi:hypothetical protein